LRPNCDEYVAVLLYGECKTFEARELNACSSVRNASILRQFSVPDEPLDIPVF